MVIPNVVMKFGNFDIFYKIYYIFDLSSALACRVLSEVAHAPSDIAPTG